MKGATAGMCILVCGVTDFLSYFIFYGENYGKSFFENFGDFSSLIEKYSVEISNYDLGLVSFEKRKKELYIAIKICIFAALPPRFYF